MKQILAIITLLASTTSYAKDQRQRINVLDNGITKAGVKKFAKALCKDGHSKNALNEEGKHGTNVISIIANKLNTKKFCIEIHNVLGKGTTMKDEFRALFASFDAKFINMSFAGDQPSKTEKQMIKVLLKKNIHIFVAAGNQNKNLDKSPTYPASYGFKTKKYHVVGSSTKTWYGKKFSNFGSVVTEKQPGTKIGWPLMTGTSQSTPNALNKFIRGIK